MGLGLEMLPLQQASSGLWTILRGAEVKIKSRLWLQVLHLLPGVLAQVTSPSLGHGQKEVNGVVTMLKGPFQLSHSMRLTRSLLEG